MTIEATGFLYPFIDGDETDLEGLLRDLASSAREKIAESRARRATTVRDCGEALLAAAADMAARIHRGGRVLTFGNGGSATDAEAAADLFRHPARGCPVPAICLVDDRAVLTALANDVGFDLVFARQIIAHARVDDMAIGFSTSGDSKNVLRAMEECTRRGVLTVGLCGNAGGAMAANPHINHLLHVRDASVHRIQESQDELISVLWSNIQTLLERASLEADPS